MKFAIRTRLSLIYSVILIVVIGALELAGYLNVQSAMHSLVDHELETRMAGVQDHIARHLPRYGWTKMGKDLEAHPAFQPSLLAVEDGSGALVFQGPAMAGTTLSNGHFSTGNSLGNSLRVLSAHSVFGGQPYTVIVSTDLQVPSAILRRLWLIMLVSMPPLLLLCLAAGYWMSGRAMTPIQEMVAAVRSIDSRRLNQRVPVPATGDELQQLAETFNSMLERIETGFAKMRDFIANASHELRTPVAIVRAAAEIALLRRTASEGCYRGSLERILRESERNTLLLENMLVLARADSGVENVGRHPLNLSRSLVEACEQAAPLAAARQISLRFEPNWDQHAAEIMADREQLHRLWLILLDNAIKYTPVGGGVTARLGVSDEGGIFGEIADTGIGIVPEHQSLIFDRFYRTDKARSRDMGGAGLGLSIALEIAVVHKAQIRVDSERGKGSRFCVTFPSEGSSSWACRSAPLSGLDKVTTPTP